MRLVTLALAAAALSPGQAFAQSAAPAPLALGAGETLLEVEASGSDRRRPDVMTITSGVVTTGATALEAATSNAGAASRLIEAVRGQGIAPADVRTRELSVQPRFERNREPGEDAPPRIVGYVARNTLELRLRDLGRASAIIGALYAAGANQVNGPIFALADDREALRAARQDAVAAAGREADDYAAALGMRVVRVLRVSERSARTEGGGAIIVTGSRIAAPPVEPGELETTARVWIDYVLAPR